MKFKSLTNKVTSRAGKQVLLTKKHSPTILFAVGVTGVVTTVVLASRATLKLDEVLDEAKKNQLKIDESVGGELKDGGKYDESDRQNDHKLNQIKTATKIVKLYAPAVAVGVVSIGCLTGSHVILSRRNVAVTAAYAALDKGFREYRQRVLDELGPEKEEEFRYGVTTKEIAVDTDDGVAVKTIKVLGQKHPSIYAVWFDEQSRNWSPQASYNRIFLQQQQNYANDRLNAYGHVFLNEVYDALGVPRTKAGAIVGWVKGHGDDYIDFGIFNRHDSDARAFVNGLNGEIPDAILLDFNVDGVIYDLLDD